MRFPRQFPADEIGSDPNSAAESAVQRTLRTADCQSDPTFFYRRGSAVRKIFTMLPGR